MWKGGVLFNCAIAIPNKATGAEKILLIDFSNYEDFPKAQPL
jgi:hypothetical protein